MPLAEPVIALATEIIESCIDAREKAQLRLELEEMMRASHDDFRRELVAGIAELHAQLERDIATERAERRAEAQRLDDDLKRLRDEL